MLTKVLLCLAVALTQARTCLHAQQAPNADSVPLIIYAQVFTPPAEYRRWYKEVEKCAKLKGNFDQIMWTVTPQPWKVNGYTTYGSWMSRGDTVKALILLNQQDWANEFFVKHEMLHDVLGKNGKQPYADLDSTVHDTVNIRRRHPVPPFEKCAPTYIWQMWEMDRAKHENPWKTVYRP